MKNILKTITVPVSLAVICMAALYVFGGGSMRMDKSLSGKAFAHGVPLADPVPGADAETALSVPEEETPPEEYLLPYPQGSSMFPDMDTQYAYLIIRQGLEQSFLKDNAELSLENGNEFVIKTWSSGMGLEITEGMADHPGRLEAWDNAVNVLWEMDAFLARDIKETLGADKSVTFQIVDDVHPEAVLLKIKDGCIEYNLFRDGTSPKYEVYRGY